MVVPKEVIDRLNKLDIEEVAVKLGLDVVKHKALCFMHDDHNPSISFSKAKNIYKCWVCGEGGGPIKMVQDKGGLSFQEACVWLADQFNIWRSKECKCKHIKPERNTANIFSLSQNKYDNRTFDEEICNWLIDNAKLSEQAKKFLFEERHYKGDVVQSIKIKSVSDDKRVLNALISHFGEERCLKSRLIQRRKVGLSFYFYTPCLLFPYYEQNGNLVGIQSRYLGTNHKAPRFQFMASCKTRLFNLPILNYLNYSDKLYISEGITDCLAMLSAGLKAVAIPSATILPLEDLVTLKNYDLHMFPDQDEAGQRAYIELRRFFVNHYSTITAETLPKNVNDYSDYYITTRLQEEKQQNEEIKGGSLLLRDAIK